MGKLIVLEGLDGSGKGTHTALLKEYLESTGRAVKVVDCPDYSSEGCALVKLYLGGGLGDNPDDTNAYAASMFFAADRYVSYIRQWRDYLKGEGVVIANRYTTANAYHQLSKLPREKWDEFLEWLWDFEFNRLALPRPDCVMLLDMPERVSSALVKKRSETTGRTMDIHEKDGDYLLRCREAAAYAAKKCGWDVIRCADEDSDVPYSIGYIAGLVRECAEKYL